MRRGWQVARVDTTTWAISARGFNSTAANKLLVLIDGRSVYTPLFSGVFWDVQDTLLADVDRIEVIRGPGGILWGANAVNGVINIITKAASRTQGGRVELASGNEEPGLATIRYGDELGSSAQYRAYGKFNYQDPQRTASGESGGDPLRRVQVGGRIDWKRSDATEVAIIGDANVGSMGRVDRPPTDVVDGNITARVRHVTSPGAELQVQADYDRTFRSMPGLLEEHRGTWDLDVEYRARVSSRHMLLAGGTYRLTRDRTSVPPAGSSAPPIAVVFVPASRNSPLVALFAQDEIALVPQRLTLTVGARGEHNDYTGFEFQPTVRARWIPRPRHVVWGGVTRRAHANTARRRRANGHCERPRPAHSAEARTSCPSRSSPTRQDTACSPSRSCRSTWRRTTTTTTGCAARSPGHRTCWPTGCAGRRAASRRK